MPEANPRKFKIYLDPNGSLKSQNSMTDFVEFLVNKNRADAAKEAEIKKFKEQEEQAIAEAKEKLEQEAENEEKPKQSNGFLGALGKIGGGGNDQSQEIMKLQYENLALKMEQVLASVEEGKRQQERL